MLYSLEWSRTVGRDWGLWEIIDEFTTWYSSKRKGNVILGYGQRDITLRREKKKSQSFSSLQLGCDCTWNIVFSPGHQRDIDKWAFRVKCCSSWFTGESLNELNKTAVLLWAAQDRRQRRWEQSTHCRGDLDVKLSSKDGHSTAGLQLHPSFSFTYSLRINPSETEFSDHQDTKANSSLCEGRILILRTTKLQTICQRLVISAQLHRLDLRGQFSPFLCLSQLGEGNAPNGLGKSSILFPFPLSHQNLVRDNRRISYNKQD